MKIAGGHAYLEQERKIPAELLGSPRFAGRVRGDSRGNAMFPHFDDGGLCGYELKNKNFTGFASGGEKGWSRGAELRASLAGKGLKLPILGHDDESANRAYIRQFILAPDVAAGHEFNLKYAERFRYIGPPEAFEVPEYVRQNSVPLR